MSENVETPEDTATRLGELAQKLVLDSQSIRQSVGSLVASRQLYAMAMHDLDYRLEVECGLEPKDFSAVKEVLVASAANQASHPFDERNLVALIKETLLPTLAGCAAWAEKVSAEHNEYEKRMQLDEFKEKEKERVAKSINLPFEFSGSTLDREKSLVLVGYEPALRWLAQQIVEHVTCPVAGETLLPSRCEHELPHNVAQMIHFASKPSSIRDAKLITLGGSAWENCAKSNNSWASLFEKSYLSKLSAPVDLLLVSDLAKCAEGHAFQSDITRAADAQKRLRKWCTLVKCGMVAMIPQSKNNRGIDLNTPDWEAFRMFTHLRAVTLLEQEGGSHYDILIGREDKIEGIPKEEIDQFQDKKIITG